MMRIEIEYDEGELLEAFDMGENLHNVFLKAGEKVMRGVVRQLAEKALEVKDLIRAGAEMEAELNTYRTGVKKANERKIAPTNLTKKDQEVYDLISNGSCYTPSQIAAVLDKGLATVHWHLANLIATKNIRRVRRGVYAPVGV